MWEIKVRWEIKGLDVLYEVFLLQRHSVILEYNKSTDVCIDLKARSIKQANNCLSSCDPVERDL